MNALYDLFIHVYHLAIKLSSFVNKKAHKWLIGRRGLLAELKQKIDPTQDHIWFHCASVGEFEQGRTLIELFKHNSPKYKILLTFFSPSGYEQCKNYEFADLICYLPIDTKRNAKAFLDIVQPKAAYFIKYEFWHNYLKELKKRNIPTYLVSGVLRNDHYLLKWYAASLRHNLNTFETFFVQDENTKTLLLNYGFSNSIVSGDTRFDRVKMISKKKASYIGERLANNDKIKLIAGSTWQHDETLLFEILNSELINKVQLIIVPHEIDKGHINWLADKFKNFQPKLISDEQENISEGLLIIDKVGILSSLYAFADIAYVGGGFGKGIHNTLEPASFGIPVVFGPNYHKFKEAKDLLELDAAFSIKNSTELIKVITCLINEKEKLISAGNAAKEYVTKNIGASELIFRETIKKLDQCN